MFVGAPQTVWGTRVDEHATRLSKWVHNKLITAFPAVGNRPRKGYIGTSLILSGSSANNDFNAAASCDAARMKLQRGHYGLYGLRGGISSRLTKKRFFCRS